MSSRKSHIVVVASEFPPQPGGIGNHAYYLALSLAKNNYDITVITDQRSFSNKSEIAFDASLPFRVERIKKKRLRVFMYLDRVLKTLVFAKKADTVIATGKFSLWNVAFCGVFMKYQSLAIIHGTEVNIKSKIIKSTVNNALRRFDKVVAVSHYTRSLVDAQIQKDVKVIPNGIDISNWTSQTRKIDFNGYPNLTTVGRVSLRKGQLQVIRLLPNILKRFPKVQYHCIGIDSEANSFMKIAKDLGVEANVTFHGVLNDEDLRSALMSTDIFVMLSKESKSGDVEGFGIAILEANAMGVPAIGSKNCGIEDAIDDGVTGTLINVESPKKFEESIILILENKEEFQKNAKKWAKNHDWNQIVQRYINLIS